jgi:hypothetical protein
MKINYTRFATVIIVVMVATLALVLAIIFITVTSTLVRGNTLSQSQDFNPERGQAIYSVNDTLFPPHNLFVDDRSVIASWDAPRGILLNEDFEGITFPPVGWQVTSLGIGWSVGCNGGSPGFPVPLHSVYAFTNDDVAGSSNNGCCDNLITPSVNLTNSAGYKLEFESYYSATGGQIATIEMSVDNGSTWTTLSTLLPAVNWTHIAIDLSSYSGPSGLSNVQFAFHSSDNSSQASGWAIDDIFLATPEKAVLGYQVFLDGNLLGTTSATTYACNPDSLRFGSSHLAGVKAVYAGGISEADTFSYICHFLYPPRNLIAFPNENAVNISWDPPLHSGYLADAFYPLATATAASKEVSTITSTFSPTIKSTSVQPLENVLFDNGSIVNSPGTGPGGSDESVIIAGGASYGFGMQRTGGFTVADDFTVLTNWTINTVKFQGYQTYSTNSSSFTGAYFRIYDGNPSAGGNVIWGDLITNRMTSSDFANIYRVNAPGEGTNRPVMSIVCDSLYISLVPGTYWIEWQTTGSDTLSGPWVPPAIEQGNAMQYTSGTWGDLGDPYPNSLPFMLFGTGGGTPNDIIGYNIFKYGDPVPVTYVTPTVTQFYDLNLSPGTYCYEVSALYDLSQYGFPGQIAESLKAGPACANISYCCMMPYAEDWTTGTFTTNQWSAGQNWRIAEQMGNPSPAAEFGWDPPQTDYSLALESYFMNSVPMGNSSSLYKIYLDFDIALDENSATSNEKMSAEVWNDTAWVVVAQFANDSDYVFTRQHADISNVAKNRNFKVRFRANGASSSDINYWLIDNIKVYYEFEPAYGLMSGQTDWNKVHLTWEAPVGSGILTADWIHYDDGLNADAIGTGSNTDFNYAIRFNTQQLAEYKGMALKKIGFYPVEPACSYSVKVWTGINASNLIIDQPVDSFNIGEWKKVNLNYSVLIDTSQELWIGIHCITPGGYPAGVDMGPCSSPGSSDMINLNGNLWESISETYGLNCNWNIRGMVEAVGDKSTVALKPLISSVPIQTTSLTLNRNPEYSVSKSLLPFDSTERRPEGKSNRSLVSYNIYRQSPASPYIVIGNTNNTEFDDLVPLSDCYSYYVSVVYDEGESNPSNIRIECFSGIDKVNNNCTRIYPDPATTALTIESSKPISHISIFNLHGSEVYNRQMAGESTVNLNTAGYPAGFYIIHLTIPGGSEYYSRFIVAK